MDHDRTVPLVVFTRVLHVEPLREREVALHGGELPQAPDRVAEVEVHLRPVEGALTLGLRVWQPVSLQSRHQRLRGASRHLGLEDRLPGKGREVDDGVAEPERPMDLEGQIEHRQDLVHQLVGPADDVRVILRAAADAQQPVQRSQSLMAVDRAQLGQPHRQLPIRPDLRLVNQHVERAVHRFHVVVAGVGLHRRIHVVRVLREVAGGLP